MNRLLDELLGKKAVIMSRGAVADHQDMGLVEAIDDEVIKIRKESEVVYILRHNVRLIKPFEH